MGISLSAVLLSIFKLRMAFWVNESIGREIIHDIVGYIVIYVDEIDLIDLWLLHSSTICP